MEDKERTSAEDEKDWDAVEEVSELLQEEKFLDALHLLRKLLAQHPRNPYAYNFLGIALYHTAQPEAARDAFRAALRIAPKYLGARVGLAEVLRMLGDPQAALREAQIALRQEPQDAEAMHAAALAYLALGDRNAARRYLEGFLDRHPEFEAASEAGALLAELNEASENDDEAGDDAPPTTGDGAPRASQGLLSVGQVPSIAPRPRPNARPSPTAGREDGDDDSGNDNGK